VSWYVTGAHRMAIEDRMDGAPGGTPDIAVEAPDQQGSRILRVP